MRSLGEIERTGQLPVTIRLCDILDGKFAIASCMVFSGAISPLCSLASYIQ